jgi:hypothetical protein
MISFENIMVMSRDLIRGGRIEEKHGNWTAAGELIICFATKPPDRCSSLRPFIAKLGSKSVTTRRFRSIFEFLEELDNSFPIKNDQWVMYSPEHRTPQDVSKLFRTPPKYTSHANGDCLNLLATGSYESLESPKIRFEAMG